MIASKCDCNTFSSSSSSSSSSRCDYCNRYDVRATNTVLPGGPLPRNTVLPGGPLPRTTNTVLLGGSLPRNTVFPGGSGPRERRPGPGGEYQNNNRLDDTST